MLSQSRVGIFPPSESPIDAAAKMLLRLLNAPMHKQLRNVKKAKQSIEQYIKTPDQFKYQQYSALEASLKSVHDLFFEYFFSEKDLKKMFNSVNEILAYTRFHYSEFNRCVLTSLKSELKHNPGYWQISVGNYGDSLFTHDCVDKVNKLAFGFSPNGNIAPHILLEFQGATLIGEPHIEKSTNKTKAWFTKFNAILKAATVPSDNVLATAKPYAIRSAALAGFLSAATLFADGSGILQQANNRVVKFDSPSTTMLIIMTAISVGMIALLLTVLLRRFADLKLDENLSSIENSSNKRRKNY